MPPSDDQLTLARSWIGSTEEDDVFAERYDRLGSLDAAILESMRAQLAAMLFDSPTSITTPDGLSVQYNTNVTGLQAQIKNFISLGGTDGQPESHTGPNVTQAVRDQTR